MTEMALLIPGVKQLASRTVTYTSNDLIEAFKAFNAMMLLTSINP
jgi:D-aminopeptidase